MKETTRIERRKSIEERMMGNAPRYFDVSFKNESERKIALAKGLQWFGFYFEPKGAISYVQKWLKKTNLISKPVSINSTYLSPSIVSLMKMVDSGWELSESEKTRIVNHFSPVSDDSWFPSAISINPVEESSEKTVAKPKMTLQEIRVPVAEFLSSLDLTEESWVKNKKRVALSDPQFSSSLQSIPDITKVEISFVKDWIDSRLSQYEDAFNGIDADLQEGYDTIPRLVLGSIVKRLNQMKADLSNFQQVVKVIKKASAPIKKKTVTVKKSTSSSLDKLKYQKASAEYAIASINPAKILGAKYLITFNTKYCQMTIFQAGPEGFSIKGTTLYGYDEQKSVMRRLRKPMEFLPIAAKKTIIQLEKAWSKLTTVESPAKTGRIGEDTILLKVL